MRIIQAKEITEAVAKLCWEACYYLPEDVVAGFQRAEKTEASPIGKSILQQLLVNANEAKVNHMPYCHDTGMAVVFMEIGQDVHITGGDFMECVQEGVRTGYRDGFLRKSVVGDPLVRVNTDDNTPAVVHTEIVAGDQIKITVLPKGGGSENMSAMKFLLPGEGAEGVKNFVLQTIKEAGGKACPPVVVGVGIGGSFDKVTSLAKHAVLREIGVHHPEPHIAELENELLEAINNTGIGPQGLGGTSTALWVPIETFACHITALPVAVNIQCHAARKKTIEI
ncbi:fumarate hydratase [Peribacillus cavernae]|uniref:Fumarate hydratase n=1 Tax=Peribacillus cavernae TaxID=1674310 RepID=A0A3S0VJS2_9BACI|nr:fumarate hydratase [Peribacillus cavernae]MDQ0219532.1 fumarate hydratase subunit alpha [Peribacillus cavernae]RUQ27057.1 fumarate hydratase [Peribacillus cavernae]